jgi:hypothetical protein
LVQPQKLDNLFCSKILTSNQGWQKLAAQQVTRFIFRCFVDSQSRVTNSLINKVEQTDQHLILPQTWQLYNQQNYLSTPEGKWMKPVKTAFV